MSKPRRLSRAPWTRRASRKPKGKNVGRGCAIGDWVSKGGESYALVIIDEDGGK